MIHNVDPQLSQWDVGRSISVSETNATHAHFANQGDSKAVIIDIIEGNAKIPDYLLQTGKTLIAYLVLDGVTLESKSFPVRKRERPENYVYEDDQRNYIYELITNAENAVKAANTAAETANWSATKATQAATSATTAAENAYEAANSANLAADSANKAATNAAHTAKSLMVVGKTEGEVIALDDAIDQFLVGLRIFGKTTQDGTPTTDAPVDIVSVGDNGSITVNVTGDNNAQSMIIATPSGLHGFPVSSGGNYTDANGQQWFCDEIDFASGVLIKRTNTITLVGDTSESIALQGVNAHGIANFFISIESQPAKSYYLVKNNRLILQSKPIADETTEGFLMSAPNGIYFRISSSTATNVGEFKALLQRWNTEGKALQVCYALVTPIETPLSEEELAAYAALHTYRGNTTISNDASAHMEIEYVMDAKKYIDSLVAAPPSWLTNVTLLASAWTGSDSLYSQVVTINGITEYSKVDLLPSVEQLAIFHNKDVAFVTENEDGVVTVYAIGDKPTLDYTMQAQITEVLV